MVLAVVIAAFLILFIIIMGLVNLFIKISDPENNITEERNKNDN